MRSSLIRIFIAALFIVLLVGCENDAMDDYLVRDTDKLTLSYASVSSQFTVRVKGEWSVSSDVDWLKFSPASGHGNGKDYQYVIVAPENNDGEERHAIIYIKSGDKVSQIAVTQENGLFEILEPSMSGAMFSGEEVNQAYIAIPYKKALGTEKLTAEVAISGEVSGLLVETVEDIELIQGNNTAMLPITGTPSSVGEIEFTVKITVDGRSYDTYVVKGNVTSANVILSNYFDKMVWGGDYIKNLSGVKSNRGNDADPSDSGDYIVSCTSGTDGTNNMFGSSLRPRFVDASSDPRGLLGWTGWGVFERPGYIKMGTGSYSGWIASPALDLSKLGGKADVYVSFDYALYDAGISTPFKVEGSGVASVSTLTASAIKEWKRYVIKISEAKTGDIIVWGDNSVKGANDTKGNIRYMLDNIEISTDMASDLETPLTVPTNVKKTAATGKSLSFSWDEVENATGYKLQLSFVNNPSFFTEIETSTANYTFENLVAGTKYNFKMMAVYAPNIEMNSDWTSPLEAQTDGAVLKIATPVLQILDVTHGKFVVGWDNVTGWDDVTDRKFSIELAKSSAGAAIRSYDSQTQIPGIKYRYNRFVFAGLESNTTYYCRVKLLPRSKNIDYDESDVATVQTTTLSSPSLSANVLFYKDFEDFSYGADGAWGAFGMIPIEADIKSFDPSNEFLYTGVVTTNTISNVGDSFNSASTSNAYKNHRWGNDSDWPRESSTIDDTNDKNFRVYEVAGYIKFGTGTARGRLTTPALLSLSGASNLKISMKACPYTEPNATTGNMTVSPAAENSLTFRVKINGAGTIDEASGATSIMLTNNSNQNSNPSTDRLQWTNHVINITGADASTSVTIETLASSGNYRMWLDDIKIEKK